MNAWLILLAAVCCVTGIGAVASARHMIRRSNLRLEKMVQAAMEGSFQEERFDEDIHSATESLLARYLSSSQSSLRSLEEQRDKLGRLLSDISHQTRTPMTNIRLYAQLLEERELPEGAGSLTAELIRQTEKLQGLIEALIQSSRLESGLLVPHPTRGDLSAIGARAAGQYRSRAAEKGLSILLELAPAPAVFDEKWTEEAVCNLLDNAVKYTPEGGCITVRSQSYELFSRIDIADTGPAIPEEEHAKIFGRFYRAPDAWKQEGVGIGLYLTRQILAGQGGYVKVGSAPGKGNTFSAFLPRALTALSEI